MPEPAVRTEGLGKTYRGGWTGRGSVRALDDVNLSVDPGEIFGLLGPNGAGKTTLVKILVTAVWPTEGRARLFGRPVEDPEVRRRVGYLPDGHRFPDFLTAEGVLDLFGRAGGMSREDRHQRVPEVLELVGLDDRRRSRVSTFSKGMAQRLALAHAILNDPDLVFLDEPTDGVDPVGRREIRDIILRLRDGGTTVFLNSHMLAEVEQVCDRVAILNRGAVVREGGLHELTAAEHVYVLRSTAVPESLEDQLKGVLWGLPHEGAAAPGEIHPYRIAVDSRTELNRVLDRLRAEGVEVEALEPLRQSLEEYFVDVVSEPFAAGHGGETGT